MKVLEIAPLPVEYYQRFMKANENLTAFHISNAPYSEEGFFYSSFFQEMRDFIWSFKKGEHELFGIFTAQSIDTVFKIKKIRCQFVESDEQIRVCFKEKWQLGEMLKEVWDFEKEAGEVIFSITESKSSNDLLDGTKIISLADLIQVSLLTFVRGHDCAFMEIYSTAITFEELIEKLENSVKGQDFKIRRVDNYLQTDWAKSWEEKGTPLLNEKSDDTIKRPK